MLKENDHILVGISGGEDSLTLMHVLTELQRRSPFHFELTAATVDLGFQTLDTTVLEQYCRTQGWPFQMIRLNGAELLREKNAEDRPCALCSRLRRGQLHALADKLGCNKIALGQQLDDLCVSLLIALFRGGGLKTMGPNVPADAASKRLIRPLCLIAKERIHKIAEIAQYPKVKSCPYEQKLQKDGDRFFLEQLLKQLEPRFKDIKSAMLHCMGDVRLAHLLDTRYLDYLQKDPDAGKL
ncbi:MAG: hypothetical protein J6X55_07610 [Victivallales bacterium]|nr:hypothetical protein [Victivallales bacterium]